MPIRRASQPGFPASPSRYIYGLASGGDLVLPLDLTLIDFVGGNEVFNVRPAGALTGFAISGAGATINAGYSHPNNPSPVGFLTAASTINLGGIALAHAPVPAGLFNNAGLAIETVTFTAESGWKVIPTSYTANLIGNTYTPFNYLGVMSIDAYNVSLPQTLQPQMTGARVTVQGKLLGMLVVEKPNSNFALVVPASICP